MKKGDTIIVRRAYDFTVVLQKVLYVGPSRIQNFAVVQTDFNKFQVAELKVNLNSDGFYFLKPWESNDPYNIRVNNQSSLNYGLKQMSQPLMEFED